MVVEEKMSRKALASALIMLFIVATVPASADESAEVNLMVTVVEPQYETYVGVGLLPIEDQKAYGKAYLFVPQYTGQPVILDIIKRRNVVASWEWEIMSYETKIIEHRNYDIIIDTYLCKNSDERSLLAETITYSGSSKKTPRASAIGMSALFLGKSTSP